MAYGLRLWNQAGDLVLDTADRTSRLAGVEYVSALTGSLPFAVTPGRQPLFYAITSNGGDGVTWSYAGEAFSYSVPEPCYVLYGEY